MAYDEATLFSALSSASLVRGDDAAAQRFMEKIVQYPLVVAPMSTSQRLTRLDRGLDEVMKDARRPYERSRRLGALAPSFEALLATPRAIDRFLAQLRHHLPLLPPDEINDEDVIVLTLLRTCFPKLFLELPPLRKQLTSGRTGRLKPTGRDVEAELYDPQPLLEVVAASQRTWAKVLLLDLFPALRVKNDFRYGHSTLSISDESYFDRYFVMGIPDNDVSNAEVTDAIQTASAGDGSHLLHLLADPDADRVGLVLDKAVAAFHAAPGSDEAGMGLLTVPIPNIADWADTQTLWSGPRERVVRWCSAIVLDLADTVAPQEVTEILRTSPTLSDRMEILYWAARSGERQPSWFQDAVEAVVGEVQDALLDHLKAGDEAPSDDLVTWWTEFLQAMDAGDRLKEAISAGLHDGAFAVGDVAARFVREDTDYANQGEQAMSRLDEPAFTALVPDRGDAWFSKPRVDVDRSDLSWANRRLFAQGRIGSATVSPE